MLPFTVSNDALVERTIADHMGYIVETILSRMSPDAIILRGSFGRGEGSVINRSGSLYFLSDYELDIATLSPFYRSSFAQLSQELSEHTGVQIGMRWLRPDFLTANRVGPFVVGPAPVTISLYEARYASRFLYGKDFIHTSPEIDPLNIRVDSGIELLFNRMAESLLYIPTTKGASGEEGLQDIYWVNKIILACAEALLLLWGRFHYSYQERGRRFLECAKGQLAFLQGEDELLCSLVARATEFKVRPDPTLYPDPVMDTWMQVIPLCDQVLRHMIDRAWNFTFHDYCEFPARYLEHTRTVLKKMPLTYRASLKVLEIYRYLRKGMVPVNIQKRDLAKDKVYAAIPLLFTSWTASDIELSGLLSAVREILDFAHPVHPHSRMVQIERNMLGKHAVTLWKNFCV